MIYLKEYNGEIFYEEIDPSLFYYLEPSDLTPYYDKIKKWLETIKCQMVCIYHNPMCLRH